MVLDISLFNTHHYKVRIKGKVEQCRERNSAVPTPRGSNYWKGNLWVALDDGRQLYFSILLTYSSINKHSSYFVINLLLLTNLSFINLLIIDKLSINN